MRKHNLVILKKCTVQQSCVYTECPRS